MCVFLSVRGMKLFGIIYILFLIGLYYFSEGKPCPEKTRPHKSRCDAYFKCHDLPAKSHVWIPSVCKKGLIYEHNLRLCVLPGDDWECILGVGSGGLTSNEYNNEFTIPHSINVSNVPINSRIRIDQGVEVIDNSLSPRINEFKIKSETIKLKSNISNSVMNNEDGEFMGNGEYESSGNGELVVSMQESPLQTESKSSSDFLIGNDGLVTEGTSSRIDPQLIAHLQRISQLIDGLQQTYQNQGKDQAELRPDQLNAFLAHFNIKNKIDKLNPNEEEHVDSIKDNDASSKFTDGSSNLQNSWTNKIELEGKRETSPQTKVLLSSDSPKRHNNLGYSSSNVIQKRPDGYLSLNLETQTDDHYHLEEPDILEYHKSPKIPEETLKTLLELSQQMVATQNIPKIIPHSALYSQRILPFYISADIFSDSNSPTAGNLTQYDSESPFSSAAITSKYKQDSQSQSNIYSKPGSTTVIHNNLIPLHVTATSSGEKEIVDNYGQSMGRYPSLNLDSGCNGISEHKHHHHHIPGYCSNGIFPVKSATRRPLVTTAPINHYSDQYPSPNPLEISVTTIQPFDYQVASAIGEDIFTPSPHLNDNNVHHLYETSDRFGAVQYNSNQGPVDRMQPHKNQSLLQIDLFNQQQQQVQQHNLNQVNTASPLSQVVLNNFKKRPGGRPVLEAMEENASDEIFNYDKNQAFSYNEKGSQLGSVFSNQYSSPFSPGNNDRLHYTSQDFMLGPQSFNYPIRTAPTYSNKNNNNKININHSKSKYPFKNIPSESHGTDGLLVHLAGNFIRYDAFQENILPLLLNSPHFEMSNIEIITCATGIRQPNTTDCTRYYVCSKTSEKVISYSCPPFTAFNPQTRICDANIYSICNVAGVPVSNYYDQNKHHKHLSHSSPGFFQRIQDTKRRQEEALKIQQVSNFIQKHDLKINSPPSSPDLVMANSQEKDILSTYVQQVGLMTSATASTTPKSAKKRKYYCKEGDKIADQNSIYNYFVCYKNEQGHMRGHKMTCPKGLLFCSKTTMCTLAANCF